MQIDYFVGKKTTQLYAVKRYGDELKKELEKVCDLRIVEVKPLLKTGFWDIISFPRAIQRKKDNILHIITQGDAHVLNFISPKKTMVTCHDLIPLTQKGYSLFARFKFKLCCRGLQKAAQIIAISEYTKQQLQKYLKISKEKITVIYHGVDHTRFKPQTKQQKENIYKKYQLDKKKIYLLYVGNEEPRMNVDIQIKAIKKVKEKIPHIQFLKVGNPNFPGQREKLEQLIKELYLEENVRFLGYVPDEDLPRLYALATIFLYPIGDAGFGWPPLEAMACGTPIITTNVASLPEAVGNAAVTVLEKNADALAQAIEELIQSPKKRQELIKKGYVQAKKFTWQKTAQQTQKIYQKVNNEQ